MLPPLIETGTLFAAGLIAGSFSSVVGGGAILLIPVLTLWGTPLIAAIATMRVSSLIQQTVTIAAFQKGKKVDWKHALLIGACTIPGSYLGARLAIHIPEKTLAYCVACIMAVLLLASYYMDHHKMKKLKKKKVQLRWVGLGLLGAVLGIYGGFYGVAFSTIVMMLFIVLTGANFFTASANSSVVTLCMAIPATGVFIMNGSVDWHRFWPVTLGGVIGSWFGVGFALHSGMKWIRYLLVSVVFLFLVKLLAF